MEQLEKLIQKMKDQPSARKYLRKLKTKQPQPAYTPLVILLKEMYVKSEEPMSVKEMQSQLINKHGQHYGLSFISNNAEICGYKIHKKLIYARPC